MRQASGLIHKRHRRGKKRRDKVRLALRVGFSLLLIGMAVGLSAGIVHVVERPVPPFKGMAEEGAFAKALSEELSQEMAGKLSEPMPGEQDGADLPPQARVAGHPTGR